MEDKEPRLTEKQIADQIYNFTRWYCNSYDPNAELFIYANGVYRGNGVGENEVLRMSGCQLEGAEDLRQFKPERITQYIKSQAMTHSGTIEELPPSIIPFANGFLFLEPTHIPGEGKLDRTIPAMRMEDLSGRWFYTNLIPHKYDPEAKYPNWLKFLSEIVRPEDIPFLQEWVGSMFYRDVPEAAFLILTGSGQNGKSVFLDIIKEMLGHSNITTITLADLTYDDFAPAELHRKLADIADDIGNEVIRRAGRLKEASSGSTLMVQRKYGHPFDMKSYAKITYSCNEPPEIRDESDAIKMRLRVTEFPFTFAKNPQPGQRLAKDRRALMDEFRSEIPGIINWSLEGLNRFLSNGCQFSASRSTEEVWKFYKRRSKPVVCFIEECLERTEDDGDYIFPEEAYKFFEGWLKTKGIKLAVTRAKFFRDMRNEGIEPNQSKQLRMKRAYFGVRLLHGNAVTPSVCSLVVANEVVVEREGSSEARYRVTDTDPHLEELFKVLADLDRQHPNGIPRTELWKGLLTYTKANDLPEDYAKSALEFWKEDGIIFCPSEGLVKKT